MNLLLADIAEGPNRFWLDAELWLQQVERGLVATDLGLVDRALLALKRDAEVLGFRRVVRAAQASRGILGLKPGVDVAILRQTLDTAHDATISISALLDQDQYWRSIELQIVLPIKRQMRH